MSKVLTHSQLIGLLKKRQRGRAVREFARELEISHVYLMHIYSGKRDPGASVLKKLGLQREIVYRFEGEPSCQPTRMR